MIEIVEVDEIRANDFLEYKNELIKIEGVFNSNENIEVTLELECSIFHCIESDNITIRGGTETREWGLKILRDEDAYYGNMKKKWQEKNNRKKILKQC